MRPSWTDQRASDYLIVTQNAAEITRSRCSGGRIAKSIAKIDPPTDALLRALRAAEDAAGLRRGKCPALAGTDAKTNHVDRDEQSYSRRRQFRLRPRDDVAGSPAGVSPGTTFIVGFDGH